MGKILYSNSKIMKIFLLYLTSLLCSATASAQLVVNGGYTAQQLAEILAGPGFIVTNATLTGASIAAGTFDGTNSNIGASSGVILCTGDINIAPGPNTQQGAGTDNGTPGASELDLIVADTTYDAMILQFDFKVPANFITFNYVFASEEYPEHVGSRFNDVFAFFISGPGIIGEENIALIPSTNLPITINNINGQSYWQYYVDNSSDTTVQYDGFTALLTATKDNLIPCETYT